MAALPLTDDQLKVSQREATVKSTLRSSSSLKKNSNSLCGTSVSLSSSNGEQKPVETESPVQIQVTSAHSLGAEVSASISVSNTDDFLYSSDTSQSLTSSYAQTKTPAPPESTSVLSESFPALVESTSALVEFTPTPVESTPALVDYTPILLTKASSELSYNSPSKINIKSETEAILKTELEILNQNKKSESASSYSKTSSNSENAYESNSKNENVKTHGAKIHELNNKLLTSESHFSQISNNFEVSFLIK